jgi:hypothetical protein
MQHREEDRFAFLGRILFMVFFLMIICMQSNKSEKDTFFHSRYEIACNIHDISGHAVCVDAIQTPAAQKSLITLNDKTGLTLFNEDFKQSCDNSRINRQFVLLRKTTLSATPVSNCRFYYHLFSLDPTEPPLLS